MDQSRSYARPAVAAVVSCLATLTLLGASTFGATTKIDFVSPDSVFPCLDTFNLLVTTTNLSTNNHTKLIRVYTSNALQTYIDKLDYVREYKLPNNKLIKFDCHFFLPNISFYCFVFTSLSQETGAVLITSQPFCRPTINNNDYRDDHDLRRDYKEQKPSFNYDKLIPTAPIYSLDKKSLYLEEANKKESIKMIDDQPAKNYKCQCNEYFNINETSVIIFLDVLRCNNVKILNIANTEIDSGEDYGTLCVLNLLEIGYLVKVSVEKSGFPIIYVPTNSLPHLIVRDGRLAIDPQLDVNNETSSHTLRSRHLRVESSFSTNITLKLFLFKDTPANSSQFNTFASLTLIHYTSMTLILVITLAPFILLLLALTTRKRSKTVRIMTPTDTRTTVSFVDHSSVSFSFADNQSLELDYYDYAISFIPRSRSDCTNVNNNVNYSKLKRKSIASIK